MMKNNTHTPELTKPASPDEKQELVAIKDHFNSFLRSIMEQNNKTTARFDLSKVWPETNNLDELYDQLSDLKQCLDSFRPISPDTIKDMQALWDIQYTYESNRIEGNSLTFDETMHVIEKGLTIGGKPLNDHLEAINHQEAIQYVRGLSSQSSDFCERDLLSIHQLILQGIRERDAGVYRKQPVFVVKSDGTRHEFPQAFLLNKLMEDYFIFYDENKDTMHPVEMAAHLHQKLVNIHPFIDGNGRSSRLVMNLHLLKHGYPISIIDSEMSKRQEYYRILGDFQGEGQSVDGGDSRPFQLFVAQKVKESLFEYLSFLSADQNDDASDKGYRFFKTIQPYLE